MRVRVNSRGPAATSASTCDANAATSSSCGLEAAAAEDEDASCARWARSRAMRSASEQRRDAMMHARERYNTFDAFCRRQS